MDEVADTALAAAALRAEDLIADRALVDGDRDDFNHAAIAHRLADLVTEADTPLNIALFGAWGSGKSSVYELVRRALQQKPGNVALVRYDAWKYGGESLQRNFISHAANELGFREKDYRGETIKDNRDFHRGLYEKQRRADVDFKELNLRKFAPVAFFIGTFVLFIFAFSLVAGAASMLTSENFLGQIGASLPKFLAPAGLIGAVVAVAKGVLDGATVDVEQSQPAADEEFGRVFGELRDRARKKGHSRLVFFVDELDRCAPDDVVKTLTALRTFLDQRDCVFVVAADREVLEKALTALPQATTLDEESPYYSSASSFVDKVFQHQLVLPPLRGRRLTRFARDLVRERGGLWAELRGAEPKGRLLDRVVYALIPSHVRSPRRVKVLLNNFATNARIAQSREVDWLPRAREIAKLTVLQTEFPLLAADLVHEPRLPTYLLDPPIGPSERAGRLLKRHGGTIRTSATEEGTKSPPALTDVPLADEVDDESGAEAIALLAEAEQRLLRRYLERTQAAGIPDPGRDLLYLEAAGAAVGLSDSALGELVETEAPEAPQRVVDALRSRSIEERRAVARVLADMADQEFGDERANVMTALLDTAQMLGPDVSPVIDSILESVCSFQQEQELSDRFLVGTMDLALRKEDEGPLVDELFSDPRLFLTAERTGEVAAMLDRVPVRHRDAVHRQVAQHLPDAAALEPALRQLSEDAATSLMTSEALQAAMSTAFEDLDQTAATALAEALYVAVSERQASDRVASTLLRELVRYPTAYPAVRAHAEDVLAVMTAGECAAVAVIALDWADPADWLFWSGYVEVPDEVTPGVGGWAAEAAVSIISKLDLAAENSLLNAAEVIERLAPFLRAAEVAKQASVQTKLAEALAANSWWLTDEALSTQIQLHAIGRALLSVGEHFRQDVENLLVADIEQALTATVAVTGYQRAAATRLTTLRGIRELGEQLPPIGARRLLDALSSTEAPGQTERDTALTRARVALAGAVRSGRADVDFTAIPLDEILALVDAADADAHRALAEWLALDPTPEHALRVVQQVDGRPPRSLVSAIGDWAGRLDESERTAFVNSLLATKQRAPEWVRCVGQHGIDDEALAQKLVAMVQDASNAEQREEGIDLIIALAPNTHRGQKAVAGLVEGLLGTGTKVDFKLALRAVEALGTQHRSAERLRAAFKAAHDDHDRSVPIKSVEALARAGIKLPQKTVAKAAVSAWKRLWGG
ncbi:MAG: hypothetical protein QOI73_3493 [Solirubrobacteraceae bacterium]|nr:hypothetical protein [Solirubrobacteraceae bacterium]